MASDEEQVKGAANNFVDKLKDTAGESKDKVVDTFNDTKDFVENNKAKVEQFLKSVATGTIILVALALKFSALCYGCMSINASGGLGGTNVEGPPFKPTKNSKGQCNGFEELLKLPISEQLRKSLSDYSFPYANPISCNNFSILAEGFTGVRFVRWITETLTQSYAMGRKYLNIIYTCFSDPDTAFWFYPLAIPLILLGALFYSPFSHSFFGLLRSTELLPRNIFGAIALNPLSAFLTMNGFVFGLLALPILAGFIQIIYLLFFLLFYPYFADDKFIFPGDKKRRAYSGFRFIRKNVAYRWRSLGVLWLAMVAMNSNVLAGDDDKQGRIEKITKNAVIVRYSNGEKAEVSKSDVVADSELYYTPGSKAYFNNGTYSQQVNIYSKSVKQVNGVKQSVWRIGIPDTHGKEIYINDATKDQLSPIVNDGNTIPLRRGLKVVVLGRGFGKVIPNTLWLVALIWLIWIQFPGYVKNIINFVYYVVVYNQLMIAFGILLYYGVRYMYYNRSYIIGEVADKVDDVTDQV